MSRQPAPPNGPAAEIKLRVLTPDQAIAERYKAITTATCRLTEGRILESMQAGMLGVDAVLIDQGKNKFCVGRKASEIWKD